MYDTLLVKIEQPMQDLGHVQSHKIFRKLAEVLADAVQRAVLAVLQDDVQTVRAAHKALVLDNVGVIQVLQQVDLHFHVLQVCSTQVLKAHLLDSNRLTGAPVESTVDAAKGAFAQAIAQLVVLETNNVLGGPLRCAIPAGTLLTLIALLAVACLSAMVGRGGDLLLVAGRAWIGNGGLRGARVGGAVGGLRRVRHHGGRSTAGAPLAAVAVVWPAASWRGKRSSAAGCLNRVAVYVVCLRRRSRAVRAVAAGVGRGVGRAFLLVQVTETENAVGLCAVVVVAPARVARSRWRGSVRAPWPL